MEYNKTKKNIEKAAGILGIISASMYMLLAVVLIIVAFMYFGGAFNFRDYTYDYYYNRVYYTVDMSEHGTPFIIIGLPLLAMSILMLIFSIKLVKSPYLPNGELRNKKAARIWVLVLSILMGDFVVIGLTIAVLCLKDFKDPNVQTQMNNVTPNAGYQFANNSSISNPTAQNANNLYEIYNKIQEVKKLKSLDIIDDVAYKKAVTKIVTDIIKDN